jgi:hypothetical protein
VELLSCVTGKSFPDFTDLNTDAYHTIDDSCTAGDDTPNNFYFRYTPLETLLEYGRVYWGDGVFRCARVEQRRCLTVSQVIHFVLPLHVVYDLPRGFSIQIRHDKSRTTLLSSLSLSLSLSFFHHSSHTP